MQLFKKVLSREVEEKNKHRTSTIMKKTFTVLLALLYINLNVSAQEDQQTLFGDDKLSLRGFLGLNVKGLELNNQIGILSGGEIDLVINHKFNVGFFGYGMMNDVVNTDVVEGETFYYELGYGGIKLEPVLFSHSLIHLTLPVNFGAGGVSLNEHRPWDYYNYDWESTFYDYDGFVFVEPGLGLEVNLFKNLRLNASAGYLFTDRINISGNLMQPLDGWTGSLSLRLGWF